uniref:START domain-containing protein n=1 Tax=Globisporangium ultimum (strain ATCC 200006 / CBS 805.95 / DAOM BR144) TaxID=431595 RepID=K3W6D0_GLOUD
MAKFPLPASTFPRLELPRKDVGELEALSNLLIERTLVQYHEHEVVRRGVIDKARWKTVRQAQGIKALRERTTSSKRAADTATNRNGSVIPMLMVTGTIPGDLFDVMYGVLNPTTEAMRIKSSYDDDGLIDGCVLATLIKPSAEDPLRSLTLRWAVKRNPLFMAPVVRNRDAVYIESTGIAYTKSGERIGYQLVHSVELPGVHELVEHQIIRANFSLCYIYRQKTIETVDVFMHGIQNPRGVMPPSVGVITIAEALVSVSTYVHCAEMKKLAWLLRSAKTTLKADPPSDASQFHSDFLSFTEICLRRVLKPDLLQVLCYQENQFDLAVKIQRSDPDQSLVLRALCGARVGQEFRRNRDRGGE